MTYKFRVPIKVRIGGTIFRVVYKQSLKHEEDDYPLCGDTSFSVPYIIRISKAEHNSLDEILATLLHECIHAALGITGQSEGMSTKGEEQLVIAMEHALKHIVSFKETKDIVWGLRTFPYPAGG